MYQRVSDANFATRPARPAHVVRNACDSQWQHQGVSRLRLDHTCTRHVSIVRDEDVVVARCHVADRWLARLVGLLGTPDLAADEGLWITPCGSVHTWGMRIPIACAFLDADGRVLRVIDPLPPWRVASLRGAAAVLETRAAGLQTLHVGQVPRHVPVRNHV